ncbi:hypothetical protein BGW38_003029 [Lunasporangiospora selenospora]|uniref:Uncharacterized protein n=1 Tax=Lunasporangiospora selenospora TaxID=979761 RepID=A0A9P6KI04_9FUNG|nr:hypothetical protein BGW38_003029 [Lunasporangiospora selenospora]
MQEFPFVCEKVTKDGIHRAGHAGIKFTENVNTVAANLVNQLRRYIPKRVVIEEYESIKGEASGIVTRRTKAPVKHFTIIASIVKNSRLCQPLQEAGT